MVGSRALFDALNQITNDLRNILNIIFTVRHWSCRILSKTCMNGIKWNWLHSTIVQLNRLLLVRIYGPCPRCPAKTNSHCTLDTSEHCTVYALPTLRHTDCLVNCLMATLKGVHNIGKSHNKGFYLVVVLPHITVKHSRYSFMFRKITEQC